LRRQISQRRAANAKLVHELEAQAGAWLRARFLRSYLRALRRAVGDVTLQAKRQDETVDFLEWAKYYIDQLDPLCPAPHDPDMMADRPGYYSPPETKVNELQTGDNIRSITSIAPTMPTSTSTRPWLSTLPRFDCIVVRRAHIALRYSTTRLVIDSTSPSDMPANVQAWFSRQPPLLKQATHTLRKYTCLCVVREKRRKEA
jgi:hypothetical protein